MALVTLNFDELTLRLMFMDFALEEHLVAANTSHAPELTEQNVLLKLLVAGLSLAAWGDAR